MAPSLSKPWYPVESYRGHVISQRGRTFRVGDNRFKSIRLAREHIELEYRSAINFPGSMSFQQAYKLSYAQMTEIAGKGEPFLDASAFLTKLTNQMALNRDTEIKRMLGEWVSELEPTVCYGPGGHLLGLGVRTEIGSDQFLVIRASGPASEDFSLAVFRSTFPGLATNPDIA